MAALDGFLLAAVSKGKSCVGGGDEAGLDVKPAHAVALSWAEVLRHAAVWNTTTSTSTTSSSSSSNPPKQPTAAAAPMLAVVAVAPLLAQTGVAYVRHLDHLLSQARPGAPGLPRIQMMQMAQAAVDYMEQSDENNNNHNSNKRQLLNERERLHLVALRHLLHDRPRDALTVVLQILQQCPGDALALSLAMDLAQTVGDKQAALRAAGSVAAYWNERRGGFVTPAIPGHSMATALMALGLAVGGQVPPAEPMAERAMKLQRSVSGGLATWAAVHIYDASGRVAEGISAAANHDGMVNYEGCGFAFFDCRLAGYGARFALDREERGRRGHKSTALRLYDRNFERVLHYSGVAATGQAWQRPLQPAPLAWNERTELSAGDDSSNDDSSSSQSTSFFWDTLLGRKKDDPKESNQKDNIYEIMVKEGHVPSTKLDGWEPTLEDVLTWLPPTPQLLSDATLLLLRFTLNGTISTQDERWDDIRNGWKALLDIQSKHGPSSSLSSSSSSSSTPSSSSMAFCPLVSVVASLLFPPGETGGDQIGNGRLAQGLYLMGQTLRLGKSATDNADDKDETTGAIRDVMIADREPNFWLPAADDNDESTNSSNNKKEWQEVVQHFTAAMNGLDSDDEDDSKPSTRRLSVFEHWDLEVRPILEHAVVYAACKSGDVPSLSLARAICSQGVTLRTNSPEEWWRYSIVLGLLGDEVASEDALNNSINIGGGQGARPT